MKPKIGLLVCDIFLKEFETVVAQGPFPEIEVVPLRCGLACSPGCDRNREGVSLASCGRFDYVLLQGRCQGERPIDLLPSAGVIPIDRGFDCFLPSPLIRSYLDEKAFLLTPGWLDAWDERLAAWGFDESAARTFFRERFSKILLLDTGIDPEAREKLAAFADHVDLAYSAVPVGLEHPRLLLESHLRSLNSAVRTEEGSFSVLNREIRIPLNGILEMTKLLQGTGLSREQRNCADVILAEGKELFSLLAGGEPQARAERREARDGGSGRTSRRRRNGSRRPAADKKTDLERQVFNRNLFLRRFFAGAESEKSIIKNFFQDTPRRLAELKMAMRSGDLPGLAEKASNLHNAAKILGGDLFADAAGEMGKAASDGEAEKIPDLFSVLLNQYEILKAAVRNAQG